MTLSGEIARQQEALTAKSKQLHLVEFWREREDIENLKPRPKPLPYIWRWRDMQPHLLWASDVVGVEDAERRGLLFANPGLQGKYHATQTLLGAYSLYNPGEVAPAHRHTPCASRFAIAGDGGYTTVNGEKCIMGRGDLILTPAGLWHDHGNDGTKPLIWMDVLDLPYVESLNCSYFEFDYFEDAEQSNSNERVQALDPDHPLSQRLFGEDLRARRHRAAVRRRRARQGRTALADVPLQMVAHARGAVRPVGRSRQSLRRHHRRILRPDDRPLGHAQHVVPRAVAAARRSD